MKQKFKAYSFVRVCDKMPVHMKHFPSGFDAIVGGTYSQLYGGHNIKSYNLYPIKNGKVVNSISWYQEEQLTTIKYKGNAQEMVENYHLKN
jgi:hypothetical protein